MRALLTSLLLLASVARVCADGALVIRDDPGGLISDYYEKYEAIQRAGTMVVIAGECDSACTLVLRLPRQQVCAMPNAQLGFHGPSMTPGGPLAPPAMVRRVAALYPPGLRRYFNTTAIHHEPARRFFRECR